jgi:Flp pilus assembly protein TadD
MNRPHDWLPGQRLFGYRQTRETSACVAGNILERRAAQAMESRSLRVLLLLVAMAANRGLAQAPAPSCIDESTRQTMAREQFKQAEEELRQVIATDQTCTDAHFLLAYDLLRQNLPRQSLAEYTTAATLRTPGPQDLRNVALDYVLLDDYPDAGHWIQRALTMDANDSENWYVLGRIRYSSGKFQDAVTAFEHTLLLAPKSVKAENNLGLTYEALNEGEKAMNAYRTAIAFGERPGEQSEQPMINLAILLAHRSDLDGALALLTRAVTLAPQDVRAREHLGQVYLGRNQLPEAQEQLEKAVSLSPEDPRLHFQLGQVYRREGIAGKAKAEFARSASLNGSHSTNP